MAQAIVAQPINFTRDDLNAAASAAQRKVGTDNAWQGAIARALVNLATGRFSYDGYQVILHSATTDARYTITALEPMKCTCKGRARGYRCWHVVAARLIVRAAEHHTEQPAREHQGAFYKGTYYSAASLEASRQARAARPTMAELTAAVDELVA